MTREEKFINLCQQVFLHLTFSGLYNKDRSSSIYKVTDQAIDKEVIFQLENLKIILRLSSRSKVLSLQSDSLKILIQTEDVYLLNTILKNAIIVEKLIDILVERECETQDVDVSRSKFENILFNNLGQSFVLEETTDFKHELDYQSESGLYSAFQSEKFICEGVFVQNKTKYSLYERHPKFEIFTIESNSVSESLNTKILNIFSLVVKINYTKFSSISLNEELGNSLYKDNEVLQSTLRSKSLLDDFQSYTGISMSYIPHKNLGFFISSKHISQQEFQSLIVDNTSTVQSKHLEINNLTLVSLENFISLLNQLEVGFEYLIPSYKQVQWIESLVNSQWDSKKNYHQGLSCYDLDHSKAFWVRDDSLKIRKYRMFFGFDDNFSLEHTTCKLVAFPKK